MIRLWAMLKQWGACRDRLSLWLENRWFDFLAWWEEQGGWFQRWPSRQVEQRKTLAKSLQWYRNQTEAGESRSEQLALWVSACLDKTQIWQPVLIWCRCQRENLDAWLIAVRPWYYRHGLHRWLRALPAVAVGLAGLGLAATPLIFTPGRLAARYAELADRSLADQHYAQAEVASLRLLQMDEKNPAYILRMAKSFAGTGKAEGAVTLAATIAPRQSVGDISAQLLIAGILLNNPTATPAALSLAEQRLQLALSAEPANAEAQALMGLCHFRAGQWEKARQFLEKVYPQRQEVALLLSITASMLGEPGNAQHWAEAAARHFQSDCRAHPDLWLPRLKWAEAESLQGHAGQALAILEAGLKPASHPSLHQRAARLIAERVARWPQDTPAAVSERLAWIWRGLGHDQQNEFLLRQLIRLAQATGPESDRAGDHLVELMWKQESLVLIQFCRGMDAWERGDLGTAQGHFEEAYESAPENPVIANNLAWLMACVDPPDYECGLKLINQVLERNPKDSVARDTRGQLYIKLNRWQEAATDLEYALPRFRNNPLFHTNLALVYEKLGKTDLSKQHTELARRIAR